MNTLDKIIAHKHKEVEERKALYPVKLLEQSIFFNSPTVSFKKYLQREDKVGIIAEFKRKSPSKGNINKYADLERTTMGYMQAGASALSILTDTEFFGGKNSDLTTVRKFNYCPILRKEFIIDEYQIIEAKSIGADVILLLANVLTPQQIKQFALFAKKLGLEILLEIRDEEELKAINEHVDAVGVNNRNLKDFSVNISQSYDLVDKIPNDFVKISESGIDAAETIINLKNAGFKGFLMGEQFMKQSRPEIACSDFIKEINALKNTLKTV
ncbi:MAG TPA: indole-3-glycerol phosphate synthase TrpC [Bacteroidia bacterium]|jgi:indole-3-glycerol phosphate synthase|nr:indole-3-glycerol phosphate synthase TrpC [Bacteroidia bacterium]